MDEDEKGRSLHSFQPGNSAKYMEVKIRTESWFLIIQQLSGRRLCALWGSFGWASCQDQLPHVQTCWHKWTQTLTHSPTMRLGGSHHLMKGCGLFPSGSKAATTDEDFLSSWKSQAQPSLFFSPLPSCLSPGLQAFSFRKHRSYQCSP